MKSRLTLICLTFGVLWTEVVSAYFSWERYDHTDLDRADSDQVLAEKRYQEVKSDYEKYQRICDAARNDAHLDIAFLRALKANETFVMLFNRYSGAKAEDLFIGAERAVKRVTMKPPKRKKTDDSLVASIDTELKLLDMRNDHSIEAVRRRTELVQKRKDILKMMKKEEDDEQRRYKMAQTNQQRAKNAAVAPYVEQVEKVGEKIVTEVEHLNAEVVTFAQKKVEACRKARDEAAAAVKARDQRVAAEKSAKKKEIEDILATFRRAGLPIPGAGYLAEYESARKKYETILAENGLVEMNFRGENERGEGFCFCEGKLSRLDVKGIRPMRFMLEYREDTGRDFRIDVDVRTNSLTRSPEIEGSFASSLMERRVAILEQESRLFGVLDLSEEEQARMKVIQGRVAKLLDRKRDSLYSLLDDDEGCYGDFSSMVKLMENLHGAERRLKEAERAVEDAKAQA